MLSVIQQSQSLLLIGHGEQGVKKVHIVVPHRNGLVLHCGIYAELKLLSLVCISECLQVAEEYAELHVKGVRSETMKPHGRHVRECT